VFAQVLQDGARGIEPPTTAFGPDHLRGEAPTSNLPAAGPTHVLQRTALQPQADRAQDATAATRLARPAVQPRRWEPPPKRSSGSRRFFRWVLLLLLVALLLAAAVVAAIELFATNSSTAVQFRNVVAHDAQQAIDQVKSLVSGYTK
jgi:hypothetical protein